MTGTGLHERRQWGGTREGVGGGVMAFNAVVCVWWTTCGPFYNRLPCLSQAGEGDVEGELGFLQSSFNSDPVVNRMHVVY